MRKVWVRNLYKERDQKGEYQLLVKELKLYDHELFFRYFRMLPGTFEVLLRLVVKYIGKTTTRLRKPISPDQRLAVSYRMSPTTVGRIVFETCVAIWKTLLEENYLKIPSEDDWMKISAEFEHYWNFPNVVGAIDGKHVQMFAPPNEGSNYYNYKKTHSIVLLGVCDARYKYTLVDIGDTGRQSDGSVYTNSKLGYAIENNLLSIPRDKKLPNSAKVLPFVFVGDDAFSLKRHLMKPYPFSNLSLDKQIFNYRLSRARRIIENTFGITASRFRVFHRPINADVEKVVAITKAVVALHNFLMVTKENNGVDCYCPHSYVDRDSPAGVIPGDWRQDARGINSLTRIESLRSSNNYGEDARLVREEFEDYFCDEGAVSWQWDIVRKTM